jgi:glycosyltransferase involved in cell wall biosynthesis
LEEGDPLVTYEAASHGLPILASEMGAGRMGDTPGALKLIDPANRDSFVEALTALVTSPELRAELGKGVHALVRNFTWSQVGKRRGALLQTWFGQSTD